MYILAALLPFVLILAYESIYSSAWIDRYYSRMTLIAYSMFALALLL